MATLNTDFIGFGEFVKRQSEGPARKILEVAQDRNAMISTMLVGMGNEVDGHTTVQRTDYIEGNFTSINEPVLSESSHTEEIRDSAGTLEVFSVIAKRIVERSANPAQTRFQEDTAAMIGMSQKMENEFFNGNKLINQKGFTGLAARYPDLLTANNRPSEQVIDAAGSGSDNTSMWLVSWDQLGTSMFFGKNYVGGLKVHDFGKTNWTVGGGEIMAYVNHFEWNMGLSIRDYRSVARIANIDVSDLAAGTVTLVPLMIKAWYKIPSALQTQRKAWYCATEVLEALTIEAQAQTNTYLTIQNFEGIPITMFFGIPIFRSDKIGVTDDAIT